MIINFSILEKSFLIKVQAHAVVKGKGTHQEREFGLTLELILVNYLIVKMVYHAE